MNASVDPQGLLRGRADIRNLYALALAEGEGLGTAYEYYVKLRLYQRLIRKWSLTPRRMLVAGLPEKYGFGLDALVLSNMLHMQTTLIPQNESRLSGFRHAYDSLVERHLLPQEVDIQVVKPGDWGETGKQGPFDLAISCGLLQACQPQARAHILGQLSCAAHHLVLLVPNASNRMHVSGSGGTRMQLEDLIELVRQHGHIPAKWGYIDMPPFPSGVKRQPADTSYRSPSVTIMQRVLQTWAGVERLAPSPFMRPFAHIVYVASRSGGTR